MDKMNWYMISATSGREDKAVELMKQAIAKQKVEQYFGEIIVPKQKETKLVRGKKQTVDTRVYPGYILIKMEMSPQSQGLIQSTKFVTGFVSVANKPSIISEAEAQKLIGKLQSSSLASAELTHGLEEGMVVKILEGPFKDFSGKIEKVNGAKVTVFVEVFGRPTPVELSVQGVMKVA